MVARVEFTPGDYSSSRTFSTHFVTDEVPGTDGDNNMSHNRFSKAFAAATTLSAILTLSAFLFALPALAADRVQDAPLPPADQIVIPYSEQTPQPDAVPSEELSVPIESPTLLATWQGAASDPAAPVAAGVDDRDNTTITGWWVYTGQTASDVLNFAVTNNARIVDLEANTLVTPIRYTVTYVSNTGAYSRAWWFYADVTAATLSAHLSANQARLTVLKAYVAAGGETHYFAVMVPNTGPDAKSWWWYVGATAPELTALWQVNNARLVQVNSYETPVGKRYAAVMISNTGTDLKSWWWYVGATQSDISTHLSANQARLIDIDYDEASASYNAIMTSCGVGCPSWWWYVNLPVSSVLSVAAQDGARIIDFNPVPCGINTCFTMVLINNANAETSRVGELLRSNTDGTVGLYLKQVGGPVAASLMDSTPFEPASTIKIATHLYTFRELSGGVATFRTNIPKYAPPVGSSCPANTPNGVESIGTADQEMMWHSDNTRTRELNDFWQVANVNNMMASIGMSQSAINHVLGCGGPPENVTTLADLGRLYEGVANGTLLNSGYRNTFNDHMAGKGEFAHEGYDWTGLWSTDIPRIIDQEAPAGMSAAAKSAFLAKMDLAYKAGNYKICQNGSCTAYRDHISIAGWASVPFCGAQPKGYVFGVFIYNATSDTSSSRAFTQTKAELLRGPIHKGLLSCAHQVSVYVPLVRR